MSDDLTSLSCPFCGGAEISQGEVLTSMGDGGTATQSMCYGCGALGPEARLPEGEVDYGDVRSTEAWNRRAAPSSRVAGDGLPPLPAPDVCEHSAFSAPNAYSAALVRQAQRDAYQAGIKAGKENR